MVISIAKDFSPTPSGVNKNESTTSGQEFYEKLLLPNYLKSIEDESDLTIDLDDLYGLPNSFIKGSFGRLFNKYPDAKVLLNFKSTDIPDWVNHILNYQEKDTKSLVLKHNVYKAQCEITELIPECNYKCSEFYVYINDITFDTMCNEFYIHCICYESIKFDIEDGNYPIYFHRPSNYIDRVVFSNEFRDLLFFGKLKEIFNNKNPSNTDKSYLNSI